MEKWPGRGDGLRGVWGRGRARPPRATSLELPFEVRRAGGEPGGELWIRVDGRHHRWRLSPDSLCAAPASRVVAAELRPAAVGDGSGAPGVRWDSGVCELREGNAAGDPFHYGMALGELTLVLRGRRLRGRFRFERTALALGGEPQWIVRRAGLSGPAGGGS